MALAQTRNNAAPEVAQVMMAELRRLREEPLAADVLQRRQNLVSGSFGRQVETTQGLGDFLANLAVQGLPMSEFGRYLASVEAVTPQQVAASLAAEIDPAQASIVIVGRASEFLEALRAQHPNVEVIPIGELDLGVGVAEAGGAAARNSGRRRFLRLKGGTVVHACAALPPRRSPDARPRARPGGAGPEHRAAWPPSPRARGIALRPHAKTHKSSDIGKRQIAAGAVGLVLRQAGRGRGAGGRRADEPASDLAGRRAGRDRAADRPERRGSKGSRWSPIIRRMSGTWTKPMPARRGRCRSSSMSIPATSGPASRRPRRRSRWRRRLPPAGSLTLAGVQYYCGKQQHIQSFAERRAAIADRTRYLRDGARRAEGRRAMPSRS